jgi:huntingtin interacting protein 1
MFRRDLIRILDLIIGTFRLEGTRLFWSMVIRIHIESHPIVSWKFCYVIHRILRDGHTNVRCLRQRES